MGWWLRIATGTVILGASLGTTLWLAKKPAGEAQVRASASQPLPLGQAQRPGAAKLAPLGPPLSADAGAYGPSAPDKVASDAAPAQRPALPEAHELTNVLCSPGMSWVSGEYCPSPAVRQRASAGRGACSVRPRALGFCIDVFEYPNQAGVLPAVLVSFNDAAQYCEREGKRLCSEAEWTHACRGPVDVAECNYGRTAKQVPVEQYWDLTQVAENLAVNDGRRPSGVSRCASAWAVFDQLGNVQEWASSEHAAGYPAAIKGGRYNQSSIGCERSIQSRRPDHRYPHTGFRCCSAPLVRVPDKP